MPDLLYNDKVIKQTKNELQGFIVTDTFQKSDDSIDFRDQGTYSDDFTFTLLPDCLRNEHDAIVRYRSASTIYRFLSSKLV